MGDDNDSVILFKLCGKLLYLIVEIGSRADVGSSIRSTSGFTASALAIQIRCCCPPDIPRADF